MKNSYLFILYPLAHFLSSCEAFFEFPPPAQQNLVVEPGCPKDPGGAANCPNDPAKSSLPAQFNRASNRYCGYYRLDGGFGNFNDVEGCFHYGDCNQDQRLSGRATYVWCPKYKCPDYERHNNVLRRCKPDDCNDRAKLLIGGTCQPCNPYERALNNGRDCGHTCTR